MLDRGRLPARPASRVVVLEPAAICQNMFLATESLGLGGWEHCGFLSLEIFERMVFRIVAAEGGSGFGNPIGLDSVFEASCPPYFPTMDAAVDAVFSRTPREATAPVPHHMSDEEHCAGTVRVSAEGLACTKAVCNYIYDTYGRFPGATDAMHLMWVMQVHHIDTDYYNRFFGSRGAHGDLASMTPGIGKAWRISNQGKRPTFRVAPPRREWRATGL